MANVNFEAWVTKVDLRPTNSGSQVLTITCAENHEKKDKDTGKYEKIGTTWWKLKAFKDDAEDLAARIEDGDLIEVSGRHITETWDSKDRGEMRDLVVYYPLARVKRKGNQSRQQQRPPQEQQGGDWSTGNDQEPPY